MLHIALGHNVSKVKVRVHRNYGLWHGIQMVTALGYNARGSIFKSHPLQVFIYKVTPEKF